MRANVPSQLIFNGAAAANGTFNNAAVTDQGNGIVRLPDTAHGLKAGSHVYISGTGNYDGNHELKAVATNSFDIEAKYVAETLAGTETWVSGSRMKRPGWVAGIAAKLSAGVGSSELMSIVCDSNRGADFDVTADSHDFNTETNWAEFYDEVNRLYFEENDIIKITFANSTAKTFGVRLFIEHE
jgi:hypothetical protein